MRQTPGVIQGHLKGYAMPPLKKTTENIRKVIHQRSSRHSLLDKVERNLEAERHQNYSR